MSADTTGMQISIMGREFRVACPEDEQKGLLEAVDYLNVFDEATPLELIRAVRPDVLVKGADYSREQVVGAEFVEG